jgi:hypothetical protein
MNEPPHKDTAPSVANTAAPTGGWLNRSVVGMGLTSFLSDAGHERKHSLAVRRR